MGRISQEVVVAMRGALHRKLMRLPMAYFDSQQTGRIMARVTSDVGSILMFIRSGIIQLISDLILSVAIAVVLVWLQWRLAIVALVTVPLYAVNQRFFFAHLRKLSDEIRAQVAALYALLSERVSAVRVVRSFVKEEAELAALDERIDRHRALSLANTRAATVAWSSGYNDQRAGNRVRDQLWRGPDRPWNDLRRRLAGLLRPGDSALRADRPTHPVPGDSNRNPGLGRTALRNLRRARTCPRPPERPGTSQLQEAPWNFETFILPTAGHRGSARNASKVFRTRTAMESNGALNAFPGSCEE